MGKTKIEWADYVWNPVTGCSKVSEGCRNCYAKSFTERFEGTPGHYFETGFAITLRPEKLDQPLKWKRPRRIFVNSMSDLFHPEVPDLYIHKIFRIMAEANWHTFQVLTKRPERMRDVIWGLRQHFKGKIFNGTKVVWPLPNVWIGVSVENQKAADERIPLLLDTPATVRFLSCEPLLGPVDLSFNLQFEHPDNEGYGVHAIKGIDWVIAGGESGRNARPMHPEWVRDLRDQCQDAGTPFHFKQWGEWVQVHPDRDSWQFTSPPEKCASIGDSRFYRVGKKAASRMLDGRTWDEFPVICE